MWLPCPHTPNHVNWNATLHNLGLTYLQISEYGVGVFLGLFPEPEGSPYGESRLTFVTDFEC